MLGATMSLRGEVGVQMPSRKSWIVGAPLVVTAVGIGGGTAVAATSAGEGPDAPITGEALSRASAAALAHTGGGSVTETEVDDEQGAYEVEVTRSDGTRVDVHLDAGFAVLSTEADGSGEDEAASR